MPAAARPRPIPDLMASMSEFSALDQRSLLRIRKTAEDPPRVSIYDVISTMTGLSSNNCSNVLQRLYDEFPEVATDHSNFKFPGRGQRDTPVTNARGIAEVIMLLPGKAAARFRKASADVAVRFLGGDPSLVDEIAANRLAQESLSEDDPARLFGQTVESEAVKRKREELNLAELDTQIKASKRRSVEEGLASLQRCGLPIDDRDRMRAKDMINQITFEQPQDANVDKEICIRQFLQGCGVRNADMDRKLGAAAKKLFLADHPDYTFPKKAIYANGQCVSANIWYESQRPYLEHALESIRGTTPPAPRTLQELWA